MELITNANTKDLIHAAQIQVPVQNDLKQCLAALLIPLAPNRSNDKMINQQQIAFE